MVRRDKSMGTARPKSPIVTVPFSVPDPCVFWNRRVVRKALKCGKSAVRVPIDGEKRSKQRLFYIVLAVVGKAVRWAVMGSAAYPADAVLRTGCYA